MKKIAIALIFMLAILGLVSGCADSPTLKRSNAPSDVLKRPSIEKRAKKKTSRTLSKVPSDVRDELSSELKASPTTPKAPSVISPPSGFYSLDTLIDFDTLDEVTYNSVKGTLSLSGHRIRTDRKADVHYLNLLADALDSDKPVFSLEWTPSSQREVDRAFAYFSDDRNNEEITTKLSKIFDANGRLNRKGALFFKALGVDVREGMNRYEFNSGLLTASGHENAGTVLRAFGSWMEAAKRDDTAGVKSGLEDLINALGLYDFTAENAARFRNGQITQVQLMDLVMPRILSGLANAFGWDDSPYVDKYWRLRRSGSSFEDAGNEAMWDLQMELNTLPRKALDAITAKVGEIVVPPDVMREVLGVEPRVRPVLTGLPDKSQLARVAFEADVFCKSLFDMPDLKAKVPKYRTYFEWRRTKRRQPMPEEGHLWTSPGDFELFEAADGRTLRFGRTPMRINIEKYLAGKISAPDPQLNEYAGLLTECYDDIAREYPVLYQLRESTKMVAVAQWLKKQGFTLSMPVAGRERVNLPAEVPGIIYMVMAIKPGSVGEILTAAGGHDFCGDRGWRYTRREIQPSQSDLVEGTIRQTKEKVEQIFNRKIDAPVPQPLGWVITKAIDGQKVTTVTISTSGTGLGTSSPVRLQRSQEEQAAFLWKSNDLDGAEQAYRKLIESCSGDVKYCASLRLILAQVLHEKGDDDRAIKEVKEADRVAPGLPLTKLLLAKALLDQGDLKGAAEALQESLSLDPNNKVAAKILDELQERQNQKGISVTSVPSTTVPLTPFNQAVGLVPTSDLEGPYEKMKKDSELTGIPVTPLKLSGKRPPRIPEPLAKTEGWKKLQAEDDKLNKDYQDIEKRLQETEKSLKELRAKKDSGEEERNKLEEKESQLKQEQVSVKEKIETLEQEMVGVLVKWEQENPEPPVSEPTQPAGNKPSVPNKEGEKP
jgi:tetratricopeptide (TPR) repeat protein